MSNFRGIELLLKNHVKARTPIVILESYEQMRVERLISSVAKDLDGYDIRIYTETKGMRSLNKRSDKTDVNDDPIAFLTERFVEGGVSNSVYVLCDLKYMNTDNSYSRRLLNLIYLAKEKGNTLILVTADAVWDRITKTGVYIKLDLPDQNERTEQIKQFVKTYEKRYHIVLTDEEIDRISTSLGGFNELQIEVLLNSVAVSDNGFTMKSISEMTKRKDSIYGRIPSVNPVVLPEEVYVSGLDNLKKWLAEKKKIFFAPESELEKRHLNTPKGILLCGVPGCGKSLSAKMIAYNWELPLYRFDIENVLNKYVGESEKNMRAALEYVDNVSPCVLWVDEIEKVLNVSDEGNETSKRILGQFLYWLQESDSRVFLVATANQVQYLPPELFRNGRFSEKFFLDLPSEKERKDALALYAKLCLLKELDEDLTEELVKLSEGFSYADIETAVKKMAEYMLVNKKEDVDGELIKQYFKQIVSTLQANSETIKKSREWGKTSAISAS